MNGGGGYTTLWVYLIPLNCMFKLHKMVNFTLWLSYPPPTHRITIRLKTSETRSFLVSMGNMVMIAFTGSDQVEQRPSINTPEHQTGCQSPDSQHHQDLVFWDDNLPRLGFKAQEIFLSILAMKS